MDSKDVSTNVLIHKNLGTAVVDFAERNGKS